MFKALKCDINKTIINIGFLGAIITVLMLCFSANIYQDSETGRTYTVIETITSLDKEIIETDFRCSNYSVFSSGLTGYGAMFLPIIVSFPFMIAYCAERNNGLMRFTIMRTGKLKYYISKFITAVFSGGLSVMIGLMLFGIACFFLFPNFSTYTLDPEFVKHMGYEQLGDNVIKILINAFIFGAVSTLPGFFISSFCKNPYLITCVPFLLVYIWNISLGKVVAILVAKDNIKLVEKVECFYPDSLSKILFRKEFDSVTKLTLVFNVGIILFCLLGHIIIMNRRTDKGV